jgi:hypothetical protein
MAYAEIEPFGSYLDDVRHGRSMALTANINRDTKVKAEPFTAVEFMLAPEKNEQKPPAEAPENIANRISKDLFRM